MRPLNTVGVVSMSVFDFCILSPGPIISLLVEEDMLLSTKLCILYVLKDILMKLTFKQSSHENWICQQMWYHRKRNVIQYDRVNYIYIYILSIVLKF